MGAVPFSLLFCMRIFLAIDIPESVRRELVLLIEELKKVSAPVRWTPSQNLHLTLKFLGETGEERARLAAGAAARALSEAGSFRLRLAGLGAFPNLERPLVLWVSVKEGEEFLTALARAIETCLEPLGFPREERPFSAHLTLGRVKGGGPKLRSLAAAIKAKVFSSAHPFPVTQVALYKSTLSPAGSVYEPLRFFPLRSVV